MTITLLCYIIFLLFYIVVLIVGQDIPQCYPPSSFGNLPVCIYVNPTQTNNQTWTDCGFSILLPCLDLKSAILSFKLYYNPEYTGDIILPSPSPSSSPSPSPSTSTSPSPSPSPSPSSSNSTNNNNSNIDLFNYPTLVLYLLEGNYTGNNNTDISYLGLDLYITNHKNSKVVFQQQKDYLSFTEPLFKNNISEILPPLPLTSNSSSSSTSSSPIHNQLIPTNNNSNNNNNYNIKSSLKILNIQFEHIHGLIVDNSVLAGQTSQLSLSNCSVKYSGGLDGTEETVLIRLFNTQSLILQSTVFSYNNGTMIESIGTLSVVMNNATFHHINSLKGSTVINSLNDRVQIYRSLIYSCEGIYNTMFNGSIVNITKSQFSLNQAKNGGALYFTNSSVNIGTSSFTSNVASSIYGGAIYSDNAQGQYPMEIIESSFTNNQVLNSGDNETVLTPVNASAPGYGGSIFVYNCKYFSLYLCNFTGSLANSGGALFISQVDTFNSAYNQYYGTASQYGTIYSEFSNLYLFAATLYENQVLSGQFVYCNSSSFIYLNNILDVLKKPITNETTVYCQSPDSCQIEGDIAINQNCQRAGSSTTGSTSSQDSQDNTSNSRSKLSKSSLIAIIVVSSLTGVILIAVITRLAFIKFKYYRLTKLGYKIIL
ncbi:putative phosphatidylinositol phosphate kinase [Tieghemostelium lacteum]|uniref:Putative phosphatidylinositol phosphate kinase n=1 Tax=Tieghemostelium lacteum TaxID=361077 RepID=A0A151ZGT1_TIELA|nr:putative phosphatidylinositol phosphate kinase [Tieghemostelium lacteum]|eukprot:KYQ93173.1 putative phosphatidylinositol phosphate kinase [Tieghemostelium lacteum]